MRAPCVVILGLGRGVGLASARRFAESGWSVMIVDKDRKQLARGQDDLGELAQFLHEDQATKLGLKNALSGTLEQFDGVDVVLQIPPVPEPTSLLDIKVEDIESGLAVSARSAVMAGQVFGSEMVREIREHELATERPPYPKSFIYLLGRSALSAEAGSPAQTVMHGAVHSVMKTLAVELAPWSIRSNAVVATRGSSTEKEDWLKKRTPLGRSARAQEIADAAFFLASPQASYIIGHTLVLDGGRSALTGMMKDRDPSALL